jgi:hypothetical protein
MHVVCAAIANNHLLKAAIRYFCKQRMKNFFEKWTDWELWPFWMRYVNISPMWLWYCLRSRSMWFFTPSNPSITFGGFEGESKKEMYEQLPPGSFPKTIYITPGITFEQLKKQVEDAGFTLPFIVKPDVGMAGILFRKIDAWEQLESYHAKMPVDYLVQDLVPFPIEFSVFYYRYPGSKTGVITGFLEKEPMHVFGDGSSTLNQLIHRHPKAKYRLEELLAWHEKKLSAILPAGEKYYLSYAANLNRGANFVNLHKEIDKRLREVFDNLNMYSREFYYGRYDLKAASLEDLKQGKNFQLLEYNGSGAEPNHVYNSGYRLRDAHKEILKHWKVLYEISKISHQQGVPYWSFSKGWRFLQDAKKHFKLLISLDTRI